MVVFEAAAVAAVSSVVGKALSPLSDGIIETWVATSKLGLTIRALKTELLYAHGMLNNVCGVDIRNESLEELLLKLQDLAYGAGDALDELDYFRIQDQVEGTHETADRGCFRDFIRDTRHSTKAAVSKLSSCVPCRAHDKDLDDDDNVELKDEPAPGNVVSQALDSQRPRNRLLCGAVCPSKSPWKKRQVKTPKLELNRVDLSRRMKVIVDELQPLCTKVATILNLELLGSNRITVKPSTADRLKTAPLTEDPHLYGREDEMKLILGYFKKCDKKELVVIPIVGHGDMGKTTFAQHVYEKAKAEKWFQATIWICVSANYNVNKLIRDIRDNIPEVEGEIRNTFPTWLKQLNLQSLKVEKCKSLSLLPPIPWTHDLRHVVITEKEPYFKILS